MGIILKMKKKKEVLFLKVRENTNEQKRVTIPKDSKIRGDSWVKVEEVDDYNEQGGEE